MSAPDYDKSIWALDSHEGDWALLILKRDAGRACVIRFIDGDWENNDSGPTDDMRRKFMRVTGKESPLPKGIDLEDFDRLYPPEDWEEVDSFSGADDVDYVLWKRRGIRSLLPPAIVQSAWRFEDEIHWEVLFSGNLRELREHFEKAKATLERKPAPAPVSEYASNPNFGRF